VSKRGKKYREALKKVDRTKFYPLLEAVSLVKETSFSKLNASVDLAVNLGVNPKYADQNVRGASTLPHGLGKTVRVVVFAKGQKAVEANECGVEFVGGDDLAQKISEGWLDFDQVIATPDMMAVVGRLGKVLGPRGLMPNPKLGTVTFDVTSAIKAAQSGRAEFRVDKAGVVHTVVGKVNMDPKNLEENIIAVIDAIQKVKPSTAKGTYLQKIALSATMGPGVRVDTTPFK